MPKNISHNKLHNRHFNVAQALNENGNQVIGLERWFEERLSSTDYIKIFNKRKIQNRIELKKIKKLAWS